MAFLIDCREQQSCSQLFLWGWLVWHWSPAFNDMDWDKDALAWISSPLMLAIGIAVGRGGKVDAGQD
ncbi:MAG: hypothetical protein F4X92_06910 [Gammaproteobacteria bacterium]|nr:hypothetical protein [Gammaproteobacteria bacterium]